MLEPKTHPAPLPSDHPDRWTRLKMALFLRELAASHSVAVAVAVAAAAAGISRQSAYRLRSRLKGKAFDIGWEVAFQHSYDNLAHAALERALNGVEVPIFYKGEPAEGADLCAPGDATLLRLRAEVSPMPDAGVMAEMRGYLPKAAG